MQYPVTLALPDLPPENCTSARIQFGEEKTMKIRVCIICVKSLDREIPTYRELQKINKLRVFKMPEQSDSRRLQNLLYYQRLILTQD
ncbi:MAG TPA: hypothetical protein VG028_14160 [Terriglobia bacterium]|nr:hypothetical protein [Terriglobia bacterium]